MEAMKRKYEIDENNETNEKIVIQFLFRLFRYLRLFPTLTGSSFQLISLILYLRSLPARA
jgi:hypothetical protein